MKKSVYFGLFVALTVFISTVMISVMLPSVALAEFICRQSVVYHWQKEKEDKPSEVHWIAVEAKGADEVIAKRALAEPAEKEKKRAHEECQKNHENLAGCTAAKFSSLASTLERMAFSQRKSVEEAIQVDCKARQGRCKGAVLAEPQCSELIVPGAAPSPAAEEGKKDTKKKK